jgi:acetyl-CoA carboxylase carboxyl transferase subunit alpha
LRYVQDDWRRYFRKSRDCRKSQALTKEIYGKLSAWQIAQVAPSAASVFARLLQSLFTGFEELHGDRAFADDLPSWAARASTNSRSWVIGLKGRDTKRQDLP